MPAILNNSRRPLVLPDGRNLPMGVVTNVPDEAWRLFRGHVVVQAWLASGSINIIGPDAVQPTKPDHADSDDDDEPENDDTFDPMAALREAAVELGVTVDGRWGEARLRREIEEARAARGD